MNDNPIGVYAMKAIKAGLTLVKMRKFLKTEEETLTLDREEVEAIMMTVREQATELRKRGSNAIH